ncbi:AAA family ATPase [Spirosoma litoris]
MYITKVELQNFKRFTDLTIDGIPTNAKLVLLIGSNGSGKSSVFDAFEFLNTGSKTHIHQKSGSQYKGAMQSLLSSLSSLKKRNDSQTTILIEDNQGESSRFEETKSPISISNLSDKAFYGRTSFRQVARLTRRQSEENSVSTIEADSDRPRTFIDRDNRFEADIDRISRQIFQEIFRNGASAQQIKDKYVEPINQAFDRIFDSQLTNRLSLIEFIPPGEGQATQVNFRKGESEISYDYLSAGEKEIFNILFNLLVRRDQFTDTVYFFDEIDLHLNTKLQFNLLKEITENWIPENCQLWTASHSLGFIDYVRQYEKGVIIDFDDLDFDQPQTLFPEPKERLDVYDIAVPKETLLALMTGKKLVFCENKNDQYYNLLAISDTIFVGVNNSADVFLKVKRDLAYSSIRDRDFISDSEIDYLHKQYPNHHILTYYCFENYLYHPKNIEELNLGWFNYKTYEDAIRRLKNERVDYILPTLVSSRQRYEEFKNDPKLDYKATDSIVDDFKSDDFERFYKFFSMKGQHEKIDPALGKIPQKNLVQTNWFRQQIQAALNR